MRRPDGWAVISEDGERASALTGTRQEAISRAKEITTNLGGGEVGVQNRHGEFREGERVEGSWAVRAFWRDRLEGSRMGMRDSRAAVDRERPCLPARPPPGPLRHRGPRARRNARLRFTRKLARVQMLR